jgi:anaphase-promoting complex subunit 4
MLMWSAGQYLAVGWSDGLVQVVSAETGNVLQHFKQVTKSSRSSSAANGHAAKNISCIGWGMNFIDVRAVKSKTGANTKNPSQSQTSQSTLNITTTDIWDEESEFASLDDFLERIPDPKKVDVPVDLPTQLARIDVTSLLPKLPALPSSAAELFTSQASIDNALHTTLDRDLNGLDTLLLCHGDGTVHLVLYDSLSLGDVDPPPEWKFPQFNHLIHASHPFACSHMLLTEIPTETDKLSKIAIIPLSLRFLHSAGSHLHMIESRTAQLETLVHYVGETIRTLNHHWKHANTIPDRFKGLVNEMLAEKEEPTLVQSLFHLSVTGDCPPTLKEWLIDNLAERVGPSLHDENPTANKHRAANAGTNI